MEVDPSHCGPGQRVGQTLALPSFGAEGAQVACKAGLGGGGVPAILRERRCVCPLKPLRAPSAHSPTPVHTLSCPRVLTLSWSPSCPCNFSPTSTHHTPLEMPNSRLSCSPRPLHTAGPYLMARLHSSSFFPQLLFGMVSEGGLDAVFWDTGSPLSRPNMLRTPTCERNACSNFWPSKHFLFTEPLRHQSRMETSWYGSPWFRDPMENAWIPLRHCHSLGAGGH